MSTLANGRVAGFGLAFIKFGRKCLYPMAELEVFEQSRKRTSISDKGKK